MKRLFSFILILTLLAVFSGCSASKETAAPTAQTQPVETVKPSEPTEATAEAPQPEETDATEEVTEAATDEILPAPQQPEITSYLQKVARADQSIFDAPSYDAVFVGTVEEAGTYTIVEEAEDAEGNLWGRLKSGIGWIDLTDVRSDAPRPLTANYADKTLLSSGKYHHCAAYLAEDPVQVALRAHEVLRDVTFCSMEFMEDDYYVAELLYSIDEMEPDMPLVIDLDFPGDMTTYGIHFTDSSGTAHTCRIYISGRNGSLVMTEDP